MMRAGWWKSLAVPLVLLLAIPSAAAPPPEDKMALAQVSASSTLVVYLHGVEGSASRLIAYLQNVVPVEAKIAESALKTFLENGSDDRKLRGLVKEGPIFLAFSELPQVGEEPKVAVILAVTDYKMFRDNLLKDDERKALKNNQKGYESTELDGKKVYFVERKGYAVVTPDEKIAADYAAKKQTGLDTKIGKEQAAKLLTGDVGFYLNMDVVNKSYAEQIKSAKEGLSSALKEAEDGPGKNQRGVFEAVRNLLDPVFQAVEDSKGMVLTIEFRPNALVVHAQSEHRPNTKTTTLLKTYKPVTLSDLDRLPSGQIIYTGIMTNPEMFKILGPLMVGAIAVPDTKAGKAMKAAVEELAKSGPGARFDVAGLPVSGVQTWQFAQPAKALAAQAQVLENLGKGDAFANGLLKEKAELKMRAAKYKNVEFHSMTLVWDLEKMAGANGMELPEDAQKKIVEGLKHILGEQSTIWIGADDKQLITVTAADWKSASALLDRHFKGEDNVGKQKGYKEAREQLPHDATLVVLVDVVSYATSVTELMKPVILSFGVTLPDKFPAKLPKGDPSFVGTAVTLNEKKIAFDLVITSSAVRDINKAFIVPLRGGF